MPCILNSWDTDLIKQAKNTFGSLYLLLTMCIENVIGQRIVIHPYVSGRTEEDACQKNGEQCLFHGQQIVLEGFVDASDLDLEVWPLTAISIAIKTDKSLVFQKLCTPNLLRCEINQPVRCYCSSVNGTIYNIVINDTISVDQSKATVRGEWWMVGSSVQYTSDPQIYPLIVETVERGGGKKKVKTESWDLVKEDVEMGTNDLVMTVTAYLLVGIIVCLQCTVVVLTVYKIWHIKGKRSRSTRPSESDQLTGQYESSDYGEHSYTSTTAVCGDDAAVGLKSSYLKERHALQSGDGCLKS